MSNLWTRWTLITVTVLPFACVLIYHVRERLQTRQTLEAQFITMFETPAESKGITARMTAKFRVADEVIAGRLSLLQAAAAFRNLDKCWPRAVILWAYFPNAASEDEVYCLKVIGYVDTVAPSNRVAELAARLHAELDAMLQNGTLRLPDSEGVSSSGGG
ncbi:MAG TPA: hypothetical protein DDY78_11425 [Planctomycetales bacterium]|jgi:hypothetical protein|nr:hypothetical protein [Planctomycetales bacterium]